MARSRNIKPGYFKNEYLAQVTPYARLLFAGLWLLADRRGRLEDRPMRIKGELFPFESVDVDSLLNELSNSDGRFITRYTIDNQSFIQVENFHRHQNPHHREAESLIPPYIPEKPRASLGLDRAKVVPSLGNSGSSRADSLLLIPDSLTPETGHSESDDSVCVSESGLGKSNQPTEDQRFAQEGADYLISLNSPTLTNLSWVRGYLGIQFQELGRSRPDLPKPQILRLWQNVCDLAVAKNASSPAWLKKVFQNKIDTLTPEEIKTHVLDQASGQSVNRWHELQTYKCIRHMLTGETFDIDELRPDGTGATGVLCGMTYLCTSQLEGIPEEETSA